MDSMFPMLLVALLVWAGILFFLFSLDRKVSALERRIAAPPERKEIEP